MFRVIPALITVRQLRGLFVFHKYTHILASKHHGPPSQHKQRQAAGHSASKQLASKGPAVRGHDNVGLAQDY